MNKNLLTFIIGIIIITLALIIHAQTGRYQFEITRKSEAQLRYYKFDTMKGTAYLCGITIPNNCFQMTKDGFEEISDIQMLEKSGFLKNKTL